MRKTLRILLVLLMVAMITCIFVACGEVEAPTVETVPPPTEVGGGNNGDGDGDGGNTVVDPTSGTPVYLTFSYLKQAPSVFKHIYIEDFKLEDIEYHVTYECIVNGKKQYLAGEGEPLTMGMLSKDSREILETFGGEAKSGHFMMFASYDAEYTKPDGTTGTKKVEGSFSLHLKSKEAALEFVEFTFELAGGYALFGDYDIATGSSTVRIEKDQNWTWAEFIADFPVYKEGYALQSVSSGGKTYNSSSSEIITASGDKTFTVGWTENKIPVTFNINLPSDVTNWAPVDSNLLTNFNSANGTWSVDVEKGEGFIPRPSVSNIATINGYTFAGWMTNTGKVWNFNRRAGDEPLTLYAMWTIRTYSVTYVFMGGEFDANKGYSNTAIGGLQRLDSDVKYALGYGPDDPEYDPSSPRDNLAFKPFMVTFSGIPYGASLSNYYTVCNIRSDVTDLISVSADPAMLQTQILKSDGCYEVSGWYTASSYHSDEVYVGGTVTDDLVLYPMWTLKENLGAQELNEYFAKKLFNYTVKSDGTLRVDLIIDTSVSELVVPESVIIDNKEYLITEIGEGAIMNIKTLISVDLSGAASLTRIGKNAFAYCPNLREVILPEGGLDINYVGESAFRGTELINSYKETHGTDFAVLGNVLVEYVGDKNVTSVDIDTTNPLLANVDTIAPGAFVELAALESVTIGDGIRYVYDRAFSRCSVLVAVSGGADLEYVASNAFDNTPYINARPTDNEETSVDESQYLRIGDIYYRFVGMGTTATIPAGIKHIAPNAFSAGHLIENINFENADDILSVGENAFSNTKWIIEDHTSAETGDTDTFIQDGFVVVNGILISKRGRDAVVELPVLVKTIASGAFDNTYVTNIQIPADSALENIEADAFAGASNLQALSFINPTEAVFVNFKDGAFSDENGRVINDEFKIYLYADPIAILATPIGESDSSALKSWKELYSTGKELFATLVTKSARFNTALGIPTNYLFNGTAVDFTAAWDLLGLLNAEKNAIVDGAIVTRSDGVESTENLVISNIGTLSGGMAILLDGTVGENKEMVFAVDGVQAETLTYSVFPAIKASTLKVYYEVGDSDVEGLPTFYTTQANFNEEEYVIKLMFVYNDGNNTLGEILLSDDIVNVAGYTPIYGVNKVLQINVDYYGLATYTINESYSVKRPQNVSIEQHSAMTISVNASLSEINTAAKEVVLRINVSDGTFKNVNIDGRASFISLDDAKNKVSGADEVSLDTTTLGYHTIGLRYGEPGEYVFSTIIYSVTLNTDGSMFTYQIKDGGAVITGLKSGYDTTVAIPARVRLTDNGVYNPASANEYTVIAIGDGAFKDKANLEYVYVPATVTSIGNEAFMGCTSLKQIRSFTVTEAIDSGLNPGRVTLTSQQATFQGEVTITALADPGVKEVAIPATITYSKVTRGGGDDGVDLDGTYNLAVKLGANVFTGYTGAISLPDTEYFRSYATNNLASNEVTFYTEGEGDKASAFVFENYDRPVILSAHKTGTVSIISRALLTVTDGVVVIPENITGEIFGDTSSYGYTFDYSITGIKSSAFEKAFEDGMRTIYLPNSLSKYEGLLEELFGAGNYASVEQHVYDVREDGIYAPSNAFPNVESIGNKAFYGCVSLGLDESGEEGYDKAAYAPYALDFSLATSLEYVGSYAFYGCTSMKALDLSQTRIGSVEASTFSGCTNLYSISLPVDYLTEIGDLAFDGCSNLGEVSGTLAVEYIGAFAFHNCKSLEVFAIGELLSFDNPNTPFNEATIATSAFDGCTALATLIVLTPDVATYDNQDFYDGSSVGCVLYTLLPQLTEVKIASWMVDGFELDFLAPFTRGAESVYSDQGVEYDVVSFTR